MSTLAMSFTSTVRVATQKDTYYPGERVEGAVELEFPRDVKVLSVRLKLVGKEKTNVTADSVQSQLSNEFVYGVTSKEYTYVRSATTLFGQRGAYEDDAFIRMEENDVPLKRISTLRAQEKQKGEEADETEEAPHRVLSQLLTHVIPAGKYIFPFGLDLPLDIPPSYSTRTRIKDGSRSQSNSTLTYYVRLYVNSSVTWCSYGEFTVLPIPINPKLPICVSANAGRLVKCKFPLSTCGCVGGSNLNATIKLESGKFTIGADPIRLAIKITNSGNNTVEKLIVSLVQRITFTTAQAQVATEEVAFSATHPVGIRSMSKIEFSNAESIIPATDNKDSPMIPTMKTSGVDVAYDLIVELNIRHTSEAKHVFKDILLVSPARSGAAHLLASTIVFPELERNKLTNTETMYTIPECPCVAPLLPSDVPPEETEEPEDVATAPPTSD